MHILGLRTLFSQHAIAVKIKRLSPSATFLTGPTSRLAVSRNMSTLKTLVCCCGVMLITNGWLELLTSQACGAII